MRQVCTTTEIGARYRRHTHTIGAGSASAARCQGRAGPAASGPHRPRLGDPEEDVTVLEIKHRPGKLGTADAFLAAPITLSHALLSGSSDTGRRGPFDRMRMAQSLPDGPLLVSIEERFDRGAYGERAVRRLW